MDLVFNCPKCGQELEVDSSGAGQEIDCPSCGEAIQIPEANGATAPEAPSAAAAPPAQATAKWGEGQAGSPIATSAAAKIERHLKVPIRTTKGETLIAKPPVPLEAAAKTSDRQLRVKCIRHIDCVEVGHDKFDQAVTDFLGKIGEANLVNVSTISYTHIDIGSQKILSDYGVLIIYRG